jgi:hypothetical protein
MKIETEIQYRKSMKPNNWQASRNTDKENNAKIWVIRVRNMRINNNRSHRQCKNKILWITLHPQILQLCKIDQSLET